MNALRRGAGGRKRKTGKNYFVTKSGKTIKVHRNLMEKWVAKREAKDKRRAERMAGLPKSRFKRLLYHLQPKRMYHYWFSRDGGIMALKILGISVAICFLLLVGLFAYFRKDLPNITDVSGGNIGGSISYYDRTGKVLLWEDYDAVKRIPVRGEEISQFVKDATIAIEDKDFYKHGGFDVRGILRAGVNDVFGIGSGGTQGGSTITQQLVKLTQNWTSERTVTRKVKELILAVELEREYSKDQILTGYLNTAPYGNIEYGVQAAANDYFHKSAKDLTLEEAAFLAAIPKSPSLYSPYGPFFDDTELLGRQQYIIDQMVSQGMITKEQGETAKKVDILATIKPQQPKYAGIKSPYFMLAAKAELENKYGAATVNRGGWKVTTTLDMNLQGIAEKTVADNARNALSRGADAQALVAQDVKTGQMVALVGGNDFENPEYGKINYAQWNISPGSSFKPYDYAALIEHSNNVGAGSVLYDAQTPLPGYPCTNKGLPPPKGQGNCLQNYDFRYPGPLTLRYALGGSRNVPAVKAMLTVGTNKVITMANDMMATPGAYKCYNPGVDVNTATKADEAPCYGSSALGDGAYMYLDRHVNGLATFARMGNAIPATYIMKIQDAANKSVYEWKQPKGKQVIRQDTAYIVNDMAADPNASYLPAGYYKWHRYNGWNTAIKTGTTNNGFDGLMTAWNTQYAVGSWVGYHTRNKTLSGTMEQLTTPLTKGFMTAALDSLNTQPVNWAKPASVKTASAFVVRNHVGIGSVEPSPASDLFPSWYQPKSGANSNQPIDKVSGKLATNCTPELAKETASNSNVSAWNIDIYVGGTANTGSAATSSGSDDVHKCSDARPSIALSANSATCQAGGGCGFTVTIGQGTHPLSSDKFKGTVNLQADGQNVATINVENPGTYAISYSPSGGGSPSITAQIIDSVLYDTTSSAVTVAIGGVNVNIASPSDDAHVSGSSVSVTWSGGTGPYSVLLKTGGGPFINVVSCTNINTTSCSVSISGNNSYQVRVEPTSGTSDTVSFTKP